MCGRTLSSREEDKLKTSKQNREKVTQSHDGCQKEVDQGLEKRITGFGGGGQDRSSF